MASSDESLCDYLLSINVKDVPKVPSRHVSMKVLVYKVYDGDTVKILFRYGTMPMKMSLRVLGVDTPEIRRSSSNPNSELEHDAAVLVRDYVADLCDKKFVDVTLHDWGKYRGRVLGDLTLTGHYGGVSLAEHLIEQGMGLPYDGGEKSEFSVEMLNNIIQRLSD